MKHLSMKEFLRCSVNLFKTAKSNGVSLYSVVLASFLSKNCKMMKKSNIATTLRKSTEVFFFCYYTPAPKPPFEFALKQNQFHTANKLQN